MMTELQKEAISLAAINCGLPPQSVNGSINTGTIDMSKFNRGGFIVSSAGTANAYLKQSANANGAGATNMQSSPQNAAAVNTNGFVTLECRSDEMTSRYLLCQIVTDAAASTCAVGIGTEPRFGPANASDNAFVATRLVCNI
jgi:hypothetical protein